MPLRLVVIRYCLGLWQRAAAAVFILSTKKAGPREPAACCRGGRLQSAVTRPVIDLLSFGRGVGEIAHRQ